MTQQELVANSAEESLDLSLRGSITHRCVAKENTEAGADLVDLGEERKDSQGLGVNPEGVA